MKSRHLFSFFRRIDFRQRYFNCSFMIVAIPIERRFDVGPDVAPRERKYRGNGSRIFTPDPRERPREPVVVDYSRNGGCLRQETATRRCVELEFEPETLDQPLTSIATSTSTFHRVQPHDRRSIRSTASSPGTFSLFTAFFSLNATTLSRTCSRRWR